ncbi:NUDIX hydrolase [Aestuariivivens sediminis]|uniref:NUDIX hydrolase n=1 Tax=Aestuariivivens sediminis TaxID=2913557 RepID=UPI001F55EA63|nr:CoA pyrophosphatase [Aestuariivivens sediminis]
MNFDEFIKSISKIKNIELPAETSHFKMVPPLRQQLLKTQRKGIENAKRAGVLALFFPDIRRQTNFVLILRKTYNGVHSAQIGFPGGKMEKQDQNLKDAALRETFEEIGVPVPAIEIIRELSSVYIPPSNFYVSPFLGITHQTPVFTKQEDEVETVIEVPLHHFMEDTVLITKKVETSYSMDVEVPAFYLNNYVVWGATAMMLSEIKDLIRQVV